jgi:Zn-dependent M28 family amino/carboxypeptidase
MESDKSNDLLSWDTLKVGHKLHFKKYTSKTYLVSEKNKENNQISKTYKIKNSKLKNFKG